MHDELRSLIGRSVELRGGEHSLQHDERMRDARLAQRERLFEARDGEGICSRELRALRHETMTIRVGFDGGDDRAGPAAKRADDREITAQSAAGDRRRARPEPAHRSTPSP